MQPWTLELIISDTSNVTDANLRNSYSDKEKNKSDIEFDKECC